MRRPAYAICFGLAASLLAPASALAARSPTANETRAITHAAVIADGSSTQSVRVTNIKVSTAGPWATATVKLYLKHDKKPEMVSEDTFFRLKGQWWDTTNGNAPQRSPPGSVVSDLGLPSSGNSTNLTHIIAYAFIGLIVLGLLALIGKISRSSADGPGPVGPVRTDSSWQPGPRSQRRTCPSCGGNRPACYMCYGRKSVPKPGVPLGSEFVTCPACGGAGKVPPPCARCGDRGWVEG